MTLTELQERITKIWKTVDNPDNIDVVVPSVFDDGYDYIDNDDVMIYLGEGIIVINLLGE